MNLRILADYHIEIIKIFKTGYRPNYENDRGRHSPNFMFVDYFCNDC